MTNSDEAAFALAFSVVWLCLAAYTFHLWRLGRSAQSPKEKGS